MKNIRDNQANPITREACAWIVQLDGDEAPSKEDLLALREWMSRSQAHRDEITRLAGLWGQLGMLAALEKLNVMQSRSMAATPSDAARGWRGPWGWQVASVAVLVLFGVFLFLRNGSPAEQSVSIATMVGEQRTATLVDGSTVQLNTDSAVVVQFTPTERRINLIRGEAHFDVSRDSERPFLVQAGDGLVRALGTSFSVRLRDAEVEVSITEGTVELATFAAPAIDLGGVARSEHVPLRPRTLAVVTAGRRAQFDSQIKSIIDLSPETLADQLAWRHGMLVFTGERLDTVIQEVERYTTLSIEFADPELAELRIGGQFRLGETDTLFKALEQGFGVAVERHDEHVVLAIARDKSAP